VRESGRWGRLLRRRIVGAKCAGVIGRALRVAWNCLGDPGLAGQLPRLQVLPVQLQVVAG